jgi:hypothetical protein
MMFGTASGSIYEVDKEAARIRRVLGEHPPTARQPADGEWREYLHITMIRRGRPVLVTWGLAGSTLDSLHSQCTFTSPVTWTEGEADDGSGEAGCPGG